MNLQEKITIQNRKGQNMVLLCERVPNGTSWAVIQHGLSGYKEEVHIAGVAEVFLGAGINVLRFDATNSFGESDGELENLTLTTHAEDLEDVMTWAKEHINTSGQPFYLAGHSLGGASVLLYTLKHPQDVKAIAPISTVLDARLREEAYKKYEPNVLAEWEKRGYREKRSSRNPKCIGKISWRHWEDCKRYDMLSEMPKITAPVFLAVGSEDHQTPPEHQRILRDTLNAPVELHVIEGAGHGFKGAALKTLQNALKKWLEHQIVRRR